MARRDAQEPPIPIRVVSQPQATAFGQCALRVFFPPRSLGARPEPPGPLVSFHVTTALCAPVAMSATEIELQMSGVAGVWRALVLCCFRLSIHPLAYILFGGTSDITRNKYFGGPHPDWSLGCERSYVWTTESGTPYSLMCIDR